MRRRSRFEPRFTRTPAQRSTEGTIVEPRKAGIIPLRPPLVLGGNYSKRLQRTAFVGAEQERTAEQ